MAHLFEEFPQELLEDLEEVVDPSRENFEEILASVAAADFPHVFLKINSVFDIVATAVVLHKISHVDEDFLLHYLEHGGRNVGVRDYNSVRELMNQLHYAGCEVSMLIVHPTHMRMN